MKKFVVLIIVGVFIIPIIYGILKYKPLFEHINEQLFIGGEKELIKVDFLSEKQFNETKDNFELLDDGYYQKKEIKSMYNNFEYILLDKELKYNKKEKLLVEKIKEDIQYFETQNDTEYSFHYLMKNTYNNKTCIYNPTKKRGYCIINYMKKNKNI